MRDPRSRTTTFIAFIAALGALACGSDDEESAGGTGGATGSPDSGAPAYTSEIYSDEANWLCLPGGAADVCDDDLDATIVRADGTLEADPYVAASDPPVDCFYVYPTISLDQTANSDLLPGDEERTTVRVQAARLGEQCRVFAPVYRQVTLGSLFGTVQSEVPSAERREIAYGDALDAWKHYLANHNEGRPLVLIGHSQGAGILNRLIQEEIDPFPDARAQLVAAYVLGSSVSVPAGADVGGDFQNVPLCRSESQTGCAVTYATFRSDAPPPSNSFFGRPRSGQGEAGCVSPAAPAGGKAALEPYFTSGSYPEAAALGVDTPFVTFPGLLEGECVTQGGFVYFELTVLGDPADPRPDDITGDLTPEWGLHLVDVDIAMGNILALVASQTAAHLAK